MIWHFLEVWILCAALFAAGCAAGASVYSGVARGPLANAQGVLADTLGDIVDEIKWRLGLAPDWRPGYEPSDRQHARPDVDPVAGDLRQAQLPTRAATEEARDELEGWREPVRRHEEATVDGSLTGGGRPDGREDSPATAATAGVAAGELRLSDESSMMRPAGLSAPRAGVADNLQRIRGVGKRNEALLHSFGIFHFGQIAAWTPAEARWVASHLAFPESLEGDDWVGQAIVLASGGDTGYLPRAERRKRAKEEEEAEEEG